MTLQGEVVDSLHGTVHAAWVFSAKDEHVCISCMLPGTFPVYREVTYHLLHDSGGAFVTGVHSDYHYTVAQLYLKGDCTALLIFRTLTDPTVSCRSHSYVSVFVRCMTSVQCTTLTFLECISSVFVIYV
jgi:hypothetical protein